MKGKPHQVIDLLKLTTFANEIPFEIKFARYKERKINKTLVIKYLLGWAGGKIETFSKNLVPNLKTKKKIMVTVTPSISAHYYEDSLVGEISDETPMIRVIKIRATMAITPQNVFI